MVFVGLLSEHEVAHVRRLWRSE